MQNKIERRFVAADLRMDDTGNGVIRGMAAVYYDGTKRTQSQNLGGFVERLKAGCFDRCLAANPDVKVLFNHSPNIVLGRTTAGTAKVWSDRAGLQFSCDLPNTSVAQDIRESIRRGDIDQCSFGFICDDDAFDQDGEDENGQRCLVRNVNGVSQLLDVSCVTYPAYPAASCSARDLFPDGVPVSIRSHVPDVEALVSFRRQRRNEVMRRVMS